MDSIAFREEQTVDLTRRKPGDAAFSYSSISPHSIAKNKTRALQGPTVLTRLSAKSWQEVRAHDFFPSPPTCSRQEHRHSHIPEFGVASYLQDLLSIHCAPSSQWYSCVEKSPSPVMLAAPAIRPSAPTSISLPSITPVAKRPSPPQQRTTLKRSIDDTESMSTPSSPSKRSRVTFDSDVETFSANEDESLDPRVVREEVRRAIQRHLAGDEATYDKIKSKFSTPQDQENAPDTHTLRLYVMGILSNVSILDKRCSSLVHTLVSSEWIGRDEAYYSLFVKLLGNIAAAHSGYVGKITQMLIDLLGPQKTRRMPGQKPVRQPLLHERTFAVIRYVTQLVPTASGAVADAIRKRISWEFSKSTDRLTYISNFLKLVDDVPELTSDILAAVMSELVKLDVFVQTDLDETDEDAEDEILDYVSSSQTLISYGPSPQEPSDAFDSDYESDDPESDVEDDPLADPEEVKKANLKDAIKQIDQIMDMLFQHFAKATTSTSLQRRDDAINQLQSLFHDAILPTFRSRHPQFLIFHFAQSSPILVDQFVASCLKTLFDKRQPQILRQSAGAYFSGFVGRGANVSPAIVRDCVDLLCQQLNDLRKAYEPVCRGPDLKRYSDFYATMQAILYIFCFRWRDLGSISSDPDESDNEGMAEEYHFSDTLRSALNMAIHSPLNPLRICTLSIVEQFAKLAFALQFLYLHSKIEANKHVSLHGHWRSLSDLHVSQPERDMSWVGDNGMMEGYFPYDPYHLPISKHWLEGDYVQWKGIPGEQIEDSDSEAEEVEEMEYLQQPRKETELE